MEAECRAITKGLSVYKEMNAMYVTSGNSKNNGEPSRGSLIESHKYYISEKVMLFVDILVKCSD